MSQLIVVPTSRSARAGDNIVIACVSHALDCIAIVEGSDGHSRVRFCATAVEVASAVPESVVSGVVFEVHADSAPDILTIAAALARRWPPIPLLLRQELRVLRMLPLRELRSQVFDLRVSVRNADSLAQCISRLLSPAEQQAARVAILTRVRDVARPVVLDIVAAAAVAGESHVSLRIVADLCNLSVRRVEERLAESHLLGAKRMMMWMLTLHSIWRVERLGWPTKRAALHAGFRSADGLSRLVERTAGFRLPELSFNGSFNGMLERFCAALTRRPREFRLDD